MFCLRQDNLWDYIRAEVREVREVREVLDEHHFSGSIFVSYVVRPIDKRSIKLASVLFRFTCTEKSDDREDEANLNYDSIAPIKLVVDGTVYTTPATTWLGVIPVTLTGDIVHHSVNDILKLLKKHDITDVEVAYRESVAKFSAGPELFTPVSDLGPLKDVIDNRLPHSACPLPV